MGKCNIFEMFSNRLSVSEIVILINQTIEHLFTRSFSYLFKPDRDNILKRAFEW